MKQPLQLLHIYLASWHTIDFCVTIDQCVGNCRKAHAHTFITFQKGTCQEMPVKACICDEHVREQTLICVLVHVHMHELFLRS